MSGKTVYNFGSIGIDRDGHYHLQWYGAHPDQGGLTERSGSMEFEDLEGLSHGIALLGRHQQHERRMELVLQKELKKLDDKIEEQLK